MATVITAISSVFLEIWEHTQTDSLILLQKQNWNEPPGQTGGHQFSEKLCQNVSGAEWPSFSDACVSLHSGSSREE